MSLNHRYAAWYERQREEWKLLLGVLLPVLMAGPGAQELFAHQHTLDLGLCISAAFLFFGSFASWVNYCFFCPVPERPEICQRCNGWGYTLNFPLRLIEDCSACRGLDEADEAGTTAAGPRQRHSGLAERKLEAAQ